LRRPERRIEVEVLISDHARHRALKREIESALRKVRRVVGVSLPTDLAVVVQQLVEKDRPLRGCYQLERRPEGRTLALIQLAAAVNGRRLSTDEVLANLAEACIRLAAQVGGEPSVLVPIEPAQPPTEEPRRPRALRPDPLAPMTGPGRVDHVA
jgi:hypothetical protein